MSRNKRKKSHEEADWVKKYRVALVMVLALVVILSGWYCISSWQKNKVPEDATLVQEQEVTDEGKS
jgi:hypothetical protein